MAKMSKMTNQFGFDFAFPGLCSLCHVEIGKFEGSDEKGTPKFVRYLPTKRATEVSLDDGSRMTVNLCESCYANFSESDIPALMESEINGWSYEVNHRLRDVWDESKRRAYLDTYKGRHILACEDRGIRLSNERVHVLKPRAEKLRVKVI